MSNVDLREVLACPRIDEVPISSTPSFNCECQQCGARVWVAYTSPIEPMASVWLAAQRMMTTSNKQSRTEQTDSRLSHN